MSLSLKDHENIPDITPSVFVGGKPQTLAPEFSSSTTETISSSPLLLVQISFKYLNTG